MVNDIGIRNDLLVAMSASEEVKILKVSCRDPKDKKVKIIAKTFHLFITQYKSLYQFWKKTQLLFV